MVCDTISYSYKSAEISRAERKKKRKIFFNSRSYFRRKERKRVQQSTLSFTLAIRGPNRTEKIRKRKENYHHSFSRVIAILRVYEEKSFPIFFFPLLSFYSFLKLKYVSSPRNCLRIHENELSVMVFFTIAFFLRKYGNSYLKNWFGGAKIRSSLFLSLFSLDAIKKFSLSSSNIKSCDDYSFCSRERERREDDCKFPCTSLSLLNGSAMSRVSLFALSFSLSPSLLLAWQHMM